MGILCLKAYGVGKLVVNVLFILSSLNTFIRTW